jgi:amino acid adenylation domain-containing protein
VTAATVQERLARLSPAQRAELRRLIGPKGIERADRSTGLVPMSYAQRRFHFLQSVAPDSAAYNVVEAVRLIGALDERRVRTALATVVARHEVLRTTCVGGDELLVAAEGPVLEYADVEDFARIADRPFRLEEEFPFRAVLASRPDGEHALLFVSHHIAADAWSSRLLVGEFLDAYARPGSLADLPIQYADFAAWERRQSYPDQLAYWRKRLAGAPPVLELPLDRPRPVTRDDRGAEVSFALDGERVRAAAREAGVTAFSLLLTAFAHVLHRHCATEDVVVGVPVAGRGRPEVERLIGCFVNTLVLRLDLGPAPTCRRLVSRVHESALDAYDHQDVPFDRLVAELGPQRDLGAGQLVQVMFNYYTATGGDPTVPGLAVEPLPVGRSSARFDLSCMVVETDGDLRCTLTYATDLLSRNLVDRLGQHLVETVDALAGDLDAPTAALPPMPSADRTLVRRTATFAEAVPDRPPLLARFEAHAAATPAAAAVRCRDDVASYGDLNARANRLAGHLAGTGVGPGHLVALLLERSVDCVVAMLAVQKAGAAYLPLDPAAPADHVVRVLAESGARLLLTHAILDRSEVAARLPAEIELAVLEELPLAGQPAGDPRRPVAADSPMYVVYTSGSTGRPKGVVVEHRNFTNYLTGILGLLAVEDGSSFALVSTLAADLGLTNLYGALATGGLVHVLPYEWAVDPDRLAGYFREHRIDVLKLVPSHLKAIEDAGLLADVVPVRHLMLAGEACPWDLVDAVRRARPDCTVWNTYGPSETTVAVLAKRVPAQRPAPGDTVVALGSTIPHVGAVVVDARLRPVPVGAAGELLITGAGVARGYLSLDDPRFTQDPFSAAESARAYLSGDRVRLRPDGEFEFLGRLDRQVKIRGYRVEPGHIEAVLRGHPDVTDVAVVVRQDKLVAYCVGEATAQLYEYARGKLPPYMMPSQFGYLDRLPLTPNGKLDQRALPEPGPRPAGPGAATPARDPVDERIAAIWCELLDLDAVGIDDDFFALGGDSFTAMRMTRQVGAGLRVASVFQHPTVRELSDLLRQPAAADALLYRLPGDRSAAVTRATIVAVPFGGGNASAFRELAAALPAGFPLYALDPPGHDVGRDSPLQPWDDLAGRCVAEIRATITGPVIVYGHCLGAALALEIARRLETGGGDVAGVVFGGAFPAPRLPGRLFDLWAKLLPSDRWRSDRLYRDTLRGIGGLTEDLEPAEQAHILRALRHDNRQAEQFYTRQFHEPDPAPTLRALVVVGERDRLTEFHEERYHEWDTHCASTALAVIPDAGHFFLKHQAGALAAAITSWFSGPEPAAAVAAVEPAVPASRAEATLWGFGLVTLGQLVSMVGTRALTFGLGVWVYLATGSATQFSVILVFGLLPALLVLPFAGAAADRWNRRLVMIIGDLVALVGSGLCLALFATGSLHVWHLYIATGLSAIAAAFQQPAYLAATTQLVPKQYLGRTNGITQALVAVSQATGPLLGGVLIVAVGLRGLLIVDLVTVLVSLATLAVVRFPDLLFRQREESIWKEIAGGVRYMARRPSFVAMIGYFLAYNLMLGFAIALTTPLALSFMSAGTLAAASTIGAIGGIAGGVAMALWGGFARRATGMIGFILLTGTGMILLGLRPSALLLGAGLAAIAASLALLNGHWQTMIQTKVGMELQGRVLASNRLVANLTEPLGYLCAGWLADRFLEPAMRAGGALSSSAGAVLGVGPGRGMALLVVLLGLAQIALGIGGLRWRTLHHMEDVLPDAIPGAVVSWDRDELQREADARTS